MKLRAAIALLGLSACTEPVPGADVASQDAVLAEVATCPNDLPTSCPTPVPSYSGELASVIVARCLPCHSAGGPAATQPLGTYAQLYARRSAVLNNVYACAMPPADGGIVLLPTERAELLGWLVCHAPDN